MKKLIPALCMLLVAACLMGTSTYAWFAANKTVNATGMQVKAAADGGLAIASWGVKDGNPEEPGENDYAASASADWTNGATTVVPTSLNRATATAETWWTGVAAENKASAVLDPAEGDPYSQYVVNGTNKGAGIFQHTMWNIRSLDSTKTTELKIGSINVTAAGNTEKLNKSVRVALKVTDGTAAPAWFVFAPLTEDASFKYVSNATTATPDTAVVATGDIAGTTIYSALSTTPITVDVFLYYDGEDSQCFSDNLALNVDQLAVEIIYTTP